MATHDIFMPALSSTMTEGKIVEWLKEPGDKVNRGESVLVVESDKADMDVEAFQEGYLAAVLMPAGSTAPVGETIGLIVETQEEIAEAQSVNLKDLKHPEKDEDRVKKSEWLVMLGICTHLGCVPLADKGEYNGWFCPCHGSHYDTSGRIRKGPAPVNMEIPKYKFIDDNTIMIG